MIATGEAAAADGLGAGEKLGDSELYAAAKAVLGDVEPGFLVSMPERARAVEATGEADADFARRSPTSRRSA